MIDPLLHQSIQYFIALLMLFAGAHKVANFERFQATVADYRLVSGGFLTLAAIVLPASELFFGIALLLSPEIRWLELGVIVVLGLYFYGMTVNLLRGRTSIDCGCSFLSHEAPLSHWHLLRNVTLMGLTAILLLPELQRVLTWLDIIQTIVTIGCFGLLYLSVEALLTNRRYL